MTQSYAKVLTLCWILESLLISDFDVVCSSIFKNVGVTYYIIGHHYHGHYLHAGRLSVNNYVRENN